MNPHRKKTHKGKDRDNKAEKLCTHCKRNRHTKDECFLIHGFPDWFKGNKNSSNSENSNSTALYSRDSPLEVDNSDDEVEYRTHSSTAKSMEKDVLRLVSQEVQRLLKGKDLASSSNSNKSDFTAFAACGPGL
ncbi:uncharacterized protein [Euphorbia lathyris]|uniref:uncharacterized protein n=1 Tax=Euphorbia lathyris TaxID=212925 RepID=UPI0033138C71